DPAQELDPRPVGSYVQANAQVAGHRDLRDGVTGVEPALGAGLELEALGEPTAMCGPLRPILGQKMDGRINVLLLPARSGCLEPVTQRVLAPGWPVILLTARDNPATNQQSPGDFNHEHEEAACHEHRLETSLSANQTGDERPKKSGRS